MADTTTPATSSFWSSPAAGAMINGGLQLAGGMASGAAQGKLTTAQMQQQQAQAALQAAMQMYGQQQQGAQAGLQATQMDPMVLAKARQKQALIESLMGNARNVSIMPSDPKIAALMPQMSGGMRLPTGGFGQDVMQNFSPNARLASETNFFSNVANASPYSPTPDFSVYGRPGQAAAGAVNQAQQGSLGRVQTEQDAVNKALNTGDQATAQQQQDDKGSGFWHKFAKYAGIAGAGVATAMTGGAASPLLIAALGAGAGAATGWGSGGGLKGALLGAAGGAIPGVGGAIAGKVASPIASQLINQGIQQGAARGINAIGQHVGDTTGGASYGQGNLYGSNAAGPRQAGMPGMTSPNQLPQGQLASQLAQQQPSTMGTPNFFGNKNLFQPQGGWGQRG